MKNPRVPLIFLMNQAEAQGFSCQNCAGTCCTYEANSMMVTPLEALELLHYLQKNNLLSESLRDKCEETIRTYRLDHAPGNGRRSYLRKTYTCPFFGFREMGCPLPREVKPYGCLAFNTHHKEQKANEHCYSDRAELEKIIFDQKNTELKQKYAVFWDKSPLPTALIDLWNKTVNPDDLALD